MTADSHISVTGAELRLAGFQHDQLQSELFSPDGMEKVAVGLCGRLAHPTGQTLLLHEVHPVPAAAYIDRSPEHVSWKTEWMVPLLEKAVRKNLSVMKFHSHPGGYGHFSHLDDESDRRLFRSLHGWFDEDLRHGSAVILPDGRLFGRTVDAAGDFAPFRKIAVAGDDILCWDEPAESAAPPDFALRHAQLFGSATTMLLNRLSVAIVGCSGTGSIVAELLARLGIGRIVLIDPDRVEEKNLNRILNSGYQDVLGERYKVDVLNDAVKRMGVGTELETYPVNICDSPAAVKAAASCDVLFGCVDKHEGRLILNKIASFYLLPYFDLGVRADADGTGNVSYVGGAIHYVQPGKSSLLSRGATNLETARAEYMKRKDPAVYAQQLKEKYIRGVREDRPAVISLNAQAASMAVNEFLARIHPFRADPNAECARTSFDLTNGLLIKERENEFPRCDVVRKYVGRGDMRPLLDTPSMDG